MTADEKNLARKESAAKRKAEAEADEQFDRKCVEDMQKWIDLYGSKELKYLAQQKFEFQEYAAEEYCQKFVAEHFGGHLACDTPDGFEFQGGRIQLQPTIEQVKYELSIKEDLKQRGVDCSVYLAEHTYVKKMPNETHTITRTVLSVVVCPPNCHHCGFNYLIPNPA